MELIAAIDLLAGRAVRLEQGDFARQIGSGEAQTVAHDWVSRGVRRLHVVDLDGARRGRPTHGELIGRIVTRAKAVSPDARVEVGGGLRSMSAIETIFEAGADDVILGTAALPPGNLLPEAAARWPGRVGAALDLRDGRPSVDAWTRVVEGEPLALARWMFESGAGRLVVTDVRRDGSGSGPNLALMGVLRTGLPDAILVAAGGISTTGDLEALAALRLDGAVVGRALLDGSLPVEAAIVACAGGAAA